MKFSINYGVSKHSRHPILSSTNCCEGEQHTFGTLWDSSSQPAGKQIYFFFTDYIPTTH